MFRPIKGVAGCTELFDSAQPLKLSCADQVINRLVSDRDIIMNGVAENFL